MRDLFVNIRDNLVKGEELMLLTITASSGSVPRGMGARMLVGKSGRICGTIGGGAVEYRAELMAKELLADKSSGNKYFRLTKNDVEDIGMICGGDVDVSFAYMAANNANIRLSEEAIRMIDQNEDAWLVMNLSCEDRVELSLYGKKTGFIGKQVKLDKFQDKPYIQCIDGGEYFIERMFESGYVYIFGGGHVSQALVPVLDSVGFRCVVLENREEFTKAELFHNKAKTMLIDFDHIDHYLDITANDYVCIMSRGHKEDTVIQAQVLKTPAYYIGVIGSVRKIAGMFAKLKDMGLKESDISRIITPIGLAIKAETPAEIAVSIAAQMIEKRAEQ